MHRLPLTLAAALFALACERVETKTIYGDLDRLDNVESADADPDELAGDTFDPNDALPPGCRDDQPVFGCPCTGTAAQRKWGNQICYPLVQPGYFIGAYCSPFGTWANLNLHDDAPDCLKRRCIDYAPEPFVQGGLPTGWPCDSNDWMQGPDPACRDTQCICDGTGQCIPRDEYEGDADIDVNAEGDYDGAVEFIGFSIPRR